MRLTHPRSKLPSRANPRCISLHPVLEVFRAYPARVQLAKRREESLGFGLELWGGICRVGCGNGMEERPGGAPKGFDVGWAVGGERWRSGGFWLFTGHSE